MSENSESKPAGFPIDFAKLDALQRHMLLNKGHMAELFGVSRTTYSCWSRGKHGIREKQLAHIRDVLRKLMRQLEEGWPTPDVVAATPAERIAKLKERIGS